MSFRGWLSWLKPRSSCARRPRFRYVSPLADGGPLDWVLEDRCLPAGLDPLVPANSAKPLNTIFWNGGPVPLNPNGVSGINYAAPTLKTITITNTTTQSIFPILRAANTGKDPANTNPKNPEGWYDPQDFHNEEYRAYIGYVQDGVQHLGLPAGATITMRVPVVFWDAENTYIGTDGQHLIPADPAKDSNPFRYDSSSDRGVSLSGEQNSWVTTFTDPSGGASGGLVMFYHAKQPQTPSLDSPAQLTEFTIRDPYLNTGGLGANQGWLTDPAQTSVLFNYDVSYVDNLIAPIAMAAADVPIPIPDVADPPTPDFGWAGSDLIYGTPTTAASMQKLISDFINNTGAASIGEYFGPPGTNGTSPGWPSYFNPGSPLQLNSVTVNNQGGGYAPATTIEFSGGGGSGAKGTVITSNGQVIGVTITDPGIGYTSAPTVTIKDGGGTSAVGQAIVNGVTQQVTEVAILSGGSGYLSVDFSGGGGSGATATPVVTGGRITGVVIANPGDGYTSAPTVTINHGGGSGATATALMLPGALKIPGGANIFANSPFNNQRSSYVTDPNNPNSLWMLSSGGSGAISQGVGAADKFVSPPQHGVETTIHLSLNQSTRPTIVHTLQQMLANGQKVEFSVAPNPTVLGTVKAYDPADKLTGIMLLPGGEGQGYDPSNPPTVNISGGGGTGAKAHVAPVNIVGGKIMAVVLDDPGSGYTSAPTVTFSGGPGGGANYIATLGGGFATMVFDQDPPLNTDISYVFSRPVTDYASLAIQNLWYSWAEFYVNQFQHFQPPAGVTGSIDKGTNTLALTSAPTGNSALAVGMTVSGSGIVPATGTAVTILEINTNGIKSIAVNDPSGGYDPKAPPIVNITGGGGSGATASAVVSAAGFITSVIVTNAGSGYTSVPKVTFTGNGSATATATVAPLVLSLSQLSPEGGSGTYTFEAPKPMPFADKTGVKSILVTNQGTGYATPPTIKFTGGGGGLGAAGTVITANGQVVGVTITGGGAQYTSAPTVTFEGGGGTGATGTAIIDSGGFVTGVTITNGGTGYLSVDITGGGGSGATATAVVSLDGHITGVAITNSGTGYTSTPTVTFHGGGGSGAVATATVGTFVTTFPLTFTKDQQDTARKFAGSVYAAMAAEAAIADYATKSPLLPPSMSLVYTVIGADIADLPNAIGKDSLVGAQVRDLIKSILRGVHDFKVVPESEWYPHPATWQGGQKFNVYNLDPYVWFVHRVLGLSGYGFSVDDDTADVSAAASNYTPVNQRVLPNNLQYVFSGLGKLTNTKQWFGSVNYGTVTDQGNILNPTSGPYQGKTILKLTTTNKYWQLVNPDLKAGQIGAYVQDSGRNILPGTTIVGQGDVKQLILILSNRAPSANNVTFTFTGDPPPNPVLNSGFEKPRLTQKPPNNFQKNPSGAQWNFDQNSGIAGNGSSLTALNGPAPEGTQAAFLQGQGTMSQTVTLQAGTYTLSFYAAQRKRGQKADSQTINVKVGDNVVGSITPSGTNYTAYLVTFTVKNAGKYTIELDGASSRHSDDTALIDVVSLAVQVQGNKNLVTARRGNRS